MSSKCGLSEAFLHEQDCDQQEDEVKQLGLFHLRILLFKKDLSLHGFSAPPREQRSRKSVINATNDCI